MAGPLTWRDVTAPDFRTALQGFGQFNELLNNALGGAQKIVTDWDAQKTTDASKQFILDALGKYDTPEAYAAAQKDGTLTAGIDPRRINDEALKFIINRPNDLLNQEATKLSNASVRQETDIRGKEFGWKTQDRNAIEAAKPFAFQMLQTVSQPGKNGGTPTEAEISQRMSTLMSDPKFASAVSQLSPDAQSNLFKNPQEVLKGALGIKQDRQQIVTNDFNMEKGRWEFEAAKADRADQLAGVAAAQQAIEGGGGDIETARSILAGKNLSPGAFAVAMNTISGTYGNLYSPESYGVQTASGGSTGGDNTNYSSMVVALESGGKANARAGTSSATGLHQFTSDTWLKTIKKANPAWARGKSDSELLALRTNPEISSQVEYAHRMDNTRALQAAGLPVNNANLYSMHHFGSTKFARAGMNTPIENILSLEQIEANPYLKGKTKGQVIEIWSRRANISPAAMLGTRDAVDGAQAVSKVNSIMGGERWLKNLESDSVPIEVATEMVKDPSMKGVPVSFFTESIDRIVRQSGGKINAANAGYILKKNMTKGAAPDFGIFNMFTRGDSRDVNLGNGMRVNWNGVDRDVQNFSTNASGDAVRSISNVKEALAAKTQAEQNYIKAQRDITAYRRAIRSNPKAINAEREAKLQAQLDAAAQTRAMANAAYDGAVMSTEGKNKTTFR